MRAVRRPISFVVATAMAVVVVSVVPFAGSAHHSVAGFFDPNKFIEIEGLVTDISWRNPHAQFSMDVADENGEVFEWRIETGALGILRAQGVDQSVLQVGDRIKVLGDVSRRGRRETFARNLLLSDGREALLTAASVPHFATTEGAEVYESETIEAAVLAAQRDANGIFRVWSTDLTEVPNAGNRMFDGNYPSLLPEAERKRAEWDASDVSLLGCDTTNTPRIMRGPLPIEFVLDGNEIVLRFEDNDSERRIHMWPVTRNDSTDISAHGFSTGRWEGDSLVVETTGLAAGRLDPHGTPVSSRLHVLERFTPKDDGTRLDYQITLTDPETFQRPFTTGRHWIWRPEITVGEFRCDEEQSL